MIGVGRQKHCNKIKVVGAKSSKRSRSRRTWLPEADAKQHRNFFPGAGAEQHSSMGILDTNSLSRCPYFFVFLQYTNLWSKKTPKTIELQTGGRRKKLAGHVFDCHRYIEIIIMTEQTSCLVPYSGVIEDILEVVDVLRYVHYTKRAPVNQMRLSLRCSRLNCTFGGAIYSLLARIYYTTKTIVTSYKYQCSGKILRTNTSVQARF
jgi:hypothetical protein